MRAAHGLAMARRPAIGASLALHGAIAGAALLPLLADPVPLRPAAPGSIEVAWIGDRSAPAAVADSAAEDAADPEPVPPPVEIVTPMPAPPPVELAAPEPAPAETAAAEPPPEPFPEPDALAEAAPSPPPPATQAPAPQPAPQPAPRPAARPAPPRPARAAPDGQAARSAAVPGPIQPAALPAATPPPGPVLVTAPRFRHPPPPPDYPPRALDFGLAGTVMIRARVAPDGRTEEIRLWRSSGHALLDAAALAAVRRWAFEPAAVDGRRVEAWVEVPVHFRLR